MPKTKKEETSDSDSGPEDRGPAKKSKSSSSDSKAKGPKGDSNDNCWEIGRNRNVKLTQFKGKWYVDIRETYTDSNGEQKPGRKGIMLTMEQWQKFKGVFDELNEAIKQNV